MDQHEREVEIRWFKTKDPHELQEEILEDDRSSEQSDDQRDLVKDDRIKIEKSPNRTMSTLVIEPLQYPDRSYYICFATNQVQTFNRTILVRVKGKNPETCMYVLR